jgi:hypothetical protein
MSIHPFRFAIPLILLGASFHSALAFPGASVPWVTYQGKNMATTGTKLGPGYAPFTVEAESSERQCVKLSATGQYVQFKARESANSLVVRYSIPDSSDGVGIDSTLSLYKNGVFVQKLAVTSKYSWLYGAYPFSNDPSQGFSRNFYNELRLPGITIEPNDTIRIEKDADDTAAYYIVNLVDLEKVAPAGTTPTKGSWLSVKNPPYNAAGDGIVDDTTAILNCIKDAITQHKSVWVPSGTYLVTGDITSTIPGDQGLHDVTIQGAGMWYTTFVGDPTLYTNQNRRVRFLGGGNNVNLSDFAIIGKLNYRNDAEENDGIFGFYGTGSSIRRCWVEHTKTGCWIVNSSGLIVEGCRFRDTLADGVNLAVGMQNTMVSNCSTRGTGDDCFAMWPTNYQPQAYTPNNNTFDHCTGELPFLASGGSIYGASGNSIRNCLFRDICGGSGVLISGNFPVGNNTFRGTTTISDCDIVRCGGYDINSASWWGSIQFAMVNKGIADSGLPGMSVRNVNIIDSLSDGITVVDGQKLDNAVLTNVHIYNFGLGAPGRHSIWASPQTQGSMTINNSTLSEKYQNDSSNFKFIPNDVNISAPLPIVPTSLAATQALHKMPFNHRFEARWQHRSERSQVTLSWLTSQYATSYHVKRATASGGPYSTIATTTNSGYVESEVPSGTTYYYVVSASNSNGESENSTEVTPTSGAATTFSTGTFKDDSVLGLIDSPSSLLESAGLGPDTPSKKTANGYLFEGYTDALNSNNTYSGSNRDHTITVANYVSRFAGLLGGQATSGDPTFDSVLDNVVEGSSQSIILTLSNLTVGETYNVLFLQVDAQGKTPRGFSVASGSAQSATQFFAFDPGPNLLGAYALGTFTATDTTQSFSVGIGYTTSQFIPVNAVKSQLNAVIVGTADPSSTRGFSYGSGR